MISHTVDTWIAGIMFWGLDFGTIYAIAYRYEIAAWWKRMIDE